MQLVVYADESGTHDKTGDQKGAREATVAGFAALADDWKLFNSQWKGVLDEDKVPYFHYNEWRAAQVRASMKQPPESDDRGDPYRGWDITKLKAFAVKLAMVAGSGNKLIVGDYVLTKRLHEAKIKGVASIGTDPYEHCTNGFFSQTAKTISEQRPPWKRLPITFIFDTSENPEWRHAIDDAFYHYHKEHPRSSFVWGDDELPENMGLQAADMLAWRTRIATAGWLDKNFDTFWPELDTALLKPMFAWLNAHPEITGPYMFSGQMFNYDTYEA